MGYDVAVIGGGLAGLVAANVAARRGKEVLLIAEGLASLHMATGCIDLLGYPGPDPESKDPVADPWEALRELIAKKPGHPYARVGLPLIAESLQWFAGVCRETGYPMVGSTAVSTVGSTAGLSAENLLLPTGMGTVRPTYLAPETMISGNLADPGGSSNARSQRNPGDPGSGALLIVGFEGFRDFHPAYAAENLQALENLQVFGARIPAPGFANTRDLSAVDLAVFFDREEFRHEVAGEIKKVLAGLDAKTLKKRVGRIGFPAVLGLEKAREARRDLEEQLGLPVFEIPILPPSIPGLRLARVLEKAARSAGVEFLPGSPVIAAQVEGGRCRSVTVQTPVRQSRYQADTFILATGGVLGGGIRIAIDGPHEPIFGLPVSHPPARQDWSQPRFLAPEGHAFLKFGVASDTDLRPLSQDGAVFCENLLAAGSILAGHDSYGEKSTEGIAIATGYAAGEWC